MCCMGYTHSKTERDGHCLLVTMGVTHITVDLVIVSIVCVLWTNE